MSFLRRIRTRTAGGITVVGGGANGFIASVVQVGIRLSNRFTLVAAEVHAAFRFAIAEITHRGQSVRVGVRTSLLGATGTLGQQTTRAAIRLTASLRDVAATNVVIRPAVRLVHSLTSALGTIVRPAFRLSLLGVTGTVGHQTSKVGVNLSPRISEFHLTAKPAFNITQFVFTLAKIAGAATQAAVGTAWTNPANAVGRADSTNATCAGSALGNTNGIELNYANSVNKAEMAITSAVLNVWGQMVDATGLLATTTISYNTGAGLTTLEVIAGAWDNRFTGGVPRGYTLGVALDTWTEYDALAARVVCTYAALSALSNAALDAIEIVIAANKTDTL